jgi:three-Cys-motif partner protein
VLESEESLITSGPFANLRLDEVPMTAPRTPIWPAEPQTIAKHTILRRYLQAWFPILSSAHPRVVYIDGFAGPGKYEGGEEGSPLIALRSAKEHLPRLVGKELVFLFVEEDAERAAWLRDVEIPQASVPSHFKVHVQRGQFEDALTELLDRLDRQGSQIAPTFAFVDPFGITGLPFALLARLLRRQGCEALVTFMSYSIQRFVTQLPEQVNELIGQLDAADKIAASPDRVGEAGRLYAASLRTAARYVSFFRMLSTNDTPIYDLFFATNHLLGFVKMKEAMWHADPTGGFRFSAGADPSQLMLLGPSPEIPLATALGRHFAGRRVLWEDIQEFTDMHPVYLAKHARHALRLMENGDLAVRGRVEVDDVKRDGTKRKRGTFPPGTSINFVGGDDQ